MATYTIYNDADYFRTIIRQIADTKPGDHVSLISMLFEPSEKTVALIIEELTAAAKRGVTVRLVIDAHVFMLSKMNLPIGPLYWRRDVLQAKFPRRFYEKVQLLEELRHAGGQYEIINEPATWPSMPIAGRSHIKATVINDVTYIGGCNLGWIGQIDYMVQIRDAKTASWTRQLIDAIAEHKSAWIAMDRQDIQRDLDNQTRIFVDAGIAKQSLIYQEALKLIDSAREWLLITCQYLPSGVVGQHLTAAHKRGVKVVSIFNHPLRQDRVTLPFQYFIFERERLRMPKSLYEGQLPLRHRRLHAKLIATDQGAMIGSHNYVITGVNLGTAETALLRLDPSFAHEAVSVLLPQLSEEIASKLQKYII